MFSPALPACLALSLTTPCLTTMPGLCAATEGATYGQ